MKRLILIMLLSLISVVVIRAQDWQYDEEHELFFNCGLIARLTTDFGERNIMKFADDDQMTLTAFFDWFLSSCADRDPGDAEAEIADMAAETELEVVAELEDGDMHIFEEADCNVTVNDRFESNLNLSFVGMRLANMSAALYMPGAAEPIDMTHKDEYVIELSSFDLPVRNQWAVGDGFPLGTYLLDVYIDGETYRLKWMREDEDVNTVVLTCVGYSADFEYGEADAIRLADGDEITLPDVGCSVRVASRFEANLNVSVAGHLRAETSVDVYLPGESKKTELSMVDHEVVNVYGIETPIRNEWIERDSFPLGLYRFDVHVSDATYQFEWLREDEAVNTIIVSCLELKADGEFDVDISAELADGELFLLEDSDCYVATIDLEADFFSTVVAGTDRDKMFVEVTYPQMSTPVQMQHVERFVSEEGIPTRIEWVEAPNFPTGAYLLSITMDERTRHFQWNRQDDVFRTIVLTCLPAGSE